MKKLCIVILFLLGSEYVNAQCCNCKNGTGVLNYATAIDKNGDMLPADAVDSNWIITLAPTNSSLSTPSFSRVISKYNTWGYLDPALLAELSANGGWISPFPETATSNNNPEPEAPYIFTYTFCVCQPGTFNIKGLVNADDWAWMNIDGKTIYTTQGNAYHVFEYDKNIYLETGKHTINTHIRNLAGVAMGFNCSGTIKPISAEAEIGRPGIRNLPDINIDLGEDRTICEDEKLILPEKADTQPGDTYLWQDGSTGRTFEVTEEGRYTVSVTNACGTITDTVDIARRTCHIFFPSVFSPNRDGRNDIAHLAGAIDLVSNYELHIYNRWGEEVFTTNNVYEG